MFPGYSQKTLWLTSRLSEFSTYLSPLHGLQPDSFLACHSLMLRSLTSCSFSWMIASYICFCLSVKCATSAPPFRLSSRFLIILPTCNVQISTVDAMQVVKLCGLNCLATDCGNISQIHFGNCRPLERLNLVKCWWLMRRKVHCAIPQLLYPCRG